MRPSSSMAAIAVGLALVLSACGTTDERRADVASPTAPATPDTPPTASMSSGATSDEAQSSTEASPAGTIVRFTTGSQTVDVTIDKDGPAVRDFLSMLPLTVELEDFNGREKIADLPRELGSRGSPGSDPEDGDLIYYVPWGNIGFYYNADGIGYSDLTLHLGTYDATADELARFEGTRTTVEVVEQ